MPLYFFNSLVHCYPCLLSFIVNFPPPPQLRPVKETLLACCHERTTHRHSCWCFDPAWEAVAASRRSDWSPSQRKKKTNQSQLVFLVSQRAPDWFTEMGGGEWRKGVSTEGMSREEEEGEELEGQASIHERINKSEKLCEWNVEQLRCNKWMNTCFCRHKQAILSYRPFRW